MGEELLKELKMRLREVADSPFFSDDELEYHYELAGKDLDKATYRLLKMKAENDAMSFSGMSMADNRKYWLDLAKLYKKRGNICI